MDSLLDFVIITNSLPMQTLKYVANLVSETEKLEWKLSNWHVSLPITIIST